MSSTPWSGASTAAAYASAQTTTAGGMALPELRASPAKWLTKSLHVGSVGMYVSMSAEGSTEYPIERRHIASENASHPDGYSGFWYSGATMGSCERLGNSSRREDGPPNTNLLPHAHAAAKHIAKSINSAHPLRPACLRLGLPARHPPLSNSDIRWPSFPRVSSSAAHARASRSYVDKEHRRRERLRLPSEDMNTPCAPDDRRTRRGNTREGHCSVP